MAGFKVFTVGEVLTAADVNSFLMSQTVMVFADAAARSTALGANVTEGMLSYLLDTQLVDVYDGATWSSVSPPLALDDLTDVDATAPNDGDVLIYDDGTGDWTATATTDITSVGALDAGSITSGFGNVDIGTSTFTGNGSGLTTLNASNLSSGTVAAARQPTGSVIQVVGNQVTTATSATGSYVAVMSQAITPSDAAHRIVIIINVTARVSFGSSMRYRLLRGSTSIHDGTSGWTFQIGNAGGGDGRAADNNRISSYAITLLDSPSTASSVTYHLEQQGSGTFNDGGSSAIVLMEVK